MCCVLYQVVYLGMIGGITVNDATRRVMSALFSNSLAVQFNFMGHGQKHAFSQLLLKDVVNGTWAFFSSLILLKLWYNL